MRRERGRTERGRRRGGKERFFVYARSSAITIFLLIIKSRMRHSARKKGGGAVAGWGRRGEGFR